jgi:hypothetical protein
MIAVIIEHGAAVKQIIDTVREIPEQTGFDAVFRQ